MKVKLNALKKTTKELNELLFDEEDAIDVTASQDELEPLVLEAAELLDLDGDDPDEISEATEKVLEILNENYERIETGKGKKMVVSFELKEDDDKKTDADKDDVAVVADEPSKKKKSKKDKAPEPDGDLEEQIEDADDVKELRKIVKEDDTFKSLRKSYGFKKLEPLREEMLEAYADAQKNPEKTSKKNKKDKKDKKDKDSEPSKNESKKSFNRVEACALALQDEPKTFDEWVERADEIMEENDGNANPKEAKSQCIKIEIISHVFDFGVKVPKLK